MSFITDSGAVFEILADALEAALKSGETVIDTETGAVYAPSVQAPPDGAVQSSVAVM